MITNFEKYSINELLSIKGAIDHYKIFGSWSDILFGNKYHKSNIELIHYGPPNLPAKYTIDKSATVSLIKQVVDFYYDEKKIKFLGRGSFGSVYQTSDETKVLKITKDDKEIIRVEKFRQIDTKGIVDYYDVREIQIKHNGDIFRPKLWCIILEKVQPLNFYEKEIWQIFSDVLQFSIWGPSDKDINFDQKVKTQIAKEHYEIYYNMVKMIKNLIESSIKYNLAFNDLHGNNMGKTNEGEYKFFDVRSNDREDLSKPLKLKPIIVNL